MNEMGSGLVHFITDAFFMLEMYCCYGLGINEKVAKIFKEWNDLKSNQFCGSFTFLVTKFRSNMLVRKSFAI